MWRRNRHARSVRSRWPPRTPAATSVPTGGGKTADARSARGACPGITGSCGMRACRCRSAQLVRRLERSAVPLLAVQLRLVPAELLAQLDDVADDDEGGRLEAGLLRQRGECG